MENLTNYYLLARRALLNSEYSDVIEYYKKILVNNPNDWEAIFYTHCAKLEIAGFDEIEDILDGLNNDLYRIFSLLAQNPMPEEWKTDFVLQCSNYIFTLTCTVTGKYWDLTECGLYANHYLEIRHCYNLFNCYKICYRFCDVIEFYFPGNTKILKEILDMRKFIAEWHQHDQKKYFDPHRIKYSKDYLEENISKLQKLSLKLNS